MDRRAEILIVEDDPGDAVPDKIAVVALTGSDARTTGRPPSRRGQDRSSPSRTSRTIGKRSPKSCRSSLRAHTIEPKIEDALDSGPGRSPYRTVCFQWDEAVGPVR